MISIRFSIFHTRAIACPLGMQSLPRRSEGTCGGAAGEHNSDSSLVRTCVC